jgi:hypothetical protein
MVESRMGSEKPTKPTKRTKYPFSLTKFHQCFVAYVPFMGFSERV